MAERESKSNADKLARLLNLSVARIYQLAKEGVIPAPVDYQWDIPTCTHNYIKFLQNQIGGNKADYGVEKTRLTRLQADRVQLEVDQLAGTLIPVHQVLDELAGIFSIVRQKLLAMPSKCALRLANVSQHEAHQILTTEIDDSLTNLTSTLVEQWENTARSANAQSATETDDQSVGELEPETVG